MSVSVRSLSRMHGETDYPTQKQLSVCATHGSTQIDADSMHARVAARSGANGAVDDIQSVLGLAALPRKNTNEE